MSFNRYGLSKKEIENIIQNKMKENPDIFYYIDDYYLEKVINAIIEGVVDAVYQSSKEIIKQVPSIMSEHTANELRRRGIR